MKSVTRVNIFLITWGESASPLFPSIVDLKQLEMILIFCALREEHLHLTKKYSKIFGVFVDLKHLIQVFACSFVCAINKWKNSFSMTEDRESR